MEVEIRQLEGENFKFLLSGVTPAFANSLRRAILREIPVMAVEEVDFVLNDSVMDDEILALRLGQLPLRTPEGYRLSSQCDCRDGRCSRCSASLSLDLEGPSIVRAEEIESSDEEVVPVSESFTLTRLDEGQRLKLTAIARLGFGKDHPSCQAAQASYKNMPIFDVDRDACTLCGDCVDVCPPNLLEIKDDEVKIADLEKCILCKLCKEACPDGAIETGHDSSKFLFRIESFGCMSPERIFGEITDILNGKCQEFIEKAESL